jgi:hypothetical protein
MNRVLALYCAVCTAHSQSSKHLRVSATFCAFYMQNRSEEAFLPHSGHETPRKLATSFVLLARSLTVP